MLLLFLGCEKTGWLKPEVRDVLPPPQPAQDGGEGDVDDVTDGVKDVGDPARIIKVLEMVPKVAFHIGI